MFSAVQSGAAASEAAEFNSQVAANNALKAEQEAAFESTQIKRRNRLRHSSRMASLAANGVEFSGSAVDALMDSAAQDELDRKVALYKGEVASRSSSAQSSLFKAEARNSRSSTPFRAAGTLLGGAGDALAIASRGN